MARIPGTVGLTGIIAPNDELDTYPVFDDIYGKGGYRVIDTLINRDNITELRRKIGMMVYVAENDNFYILKLGILNSNWVLLEFGGASGDKSYVHIQGVANTVWTIAHNLNKLPSVTVLDSALNEIEGDVQHIDYNNVVITFSSTFSGTATLN